MEPSTITIILLIFTIVMFVTEKIPLALTAMIVAISLTVSGVLTPAQSFAGFVNPSVILFASMFVVSGAFFETGMAAKTGGVLAKFAKSERQLIIATMVTTGLLGSVMSNTAAAAVFLPIVIGIAARSGFSRSRLLMPMAFAATMSGSLTLISSPPNLIAHSLLQEQGFGGYGFFDFGLVGLPVLIIGTLFFAVFGPKLLPADSGTQDMADIKEQDFSHVPKWRQNMAVIVLVTAVIAMIFSEQIGLPIHVISTIAALILVLTKVITEKQAYQSIEMRVIFLFSGTLPLATALETSGVGMMFAQWVLGLLGENATPFAVTAAIFITAVVMTSIISNTATVALLCPIAISIAITMGADPRAAAAATVVGAAMSFATPVATPPNTMVIAAGGYKFMDYVRAGVPLTVVCGTVSIILLPIMFPFFP